MLDLLRVSPDDLFPVGSDKIQSYAELVNVAIAPDNPRAHIAAEVTLDMLRSEEFTIGNDLPASVAGSNVRNGPLEPDVMYTLFYRGLSDGQRGKRQVNPGTDRLVQTSSFQPLQMTGGCIAMVTSKGVSPVIAWGISLQFIMLCPHLFCLFMFYLRTTVLPHH